jgi:hypothetical protein
LMLLSSRSFCFVCHQSHNFILWSYQASFLVFRRESKGMGRLSEVTRVLWTYRSVEGNRQVDFWWSVRGVMLTWHGSSELIVPLTGVDKLTLEECQRCNVNLTRIKFSFPWGNREEDLTYCGLIIPFKGIDKGSFDRLGNNKFYCQRCNINVTGLILRFEHFCGPIIPLVGIDKWFWWGYVGVAPLGFLANP